MGLLWPEQGVRCRDLGVPGVDSVLGGLAAGGAHGDFVVEVDFVAHVAVGPHVLDVVTNEHHCWTIRSACGGEKDHI